MMNFTFFLPADGASASQPSSQPFLPLAEALSRAGKKTQTVMVADSTAAQRHWVALPADTVPVIDARTLPAFLPLLGDLAARPTIALARHAVPTRAAQDDPARRDAFQQLYPAMRMVLASSEILASRLAEEFTIPAECLAVLPPGTQPAPRATGSNDKTCRILSVGALVARKGHDILLRALARLPDLDWRLDIVGDATRDPHCAAALRQLAQAHHITDRITFTTPPCTETHWQTADLFALASHWESHGAMVATALRHGLPVAITAGGAADSFLPQGVGAICATGDWEGLSKAMRRLICDRSLRHALADAAWHAGQTLPTWDMQARRMLQLLAPIR